ncbi:two-component response regulator [Winogradskyella psychrotolerans RS-3]|uniref:Two-component response regulator n=1 Tax=Winogradskyella psychrotolerans RS-3 TaxID=641526 RepID=S7VTD3_9FLAO|nr:helix-turn-helix transcriptional regulator [Winogradskyella psychrotolerans]EPR73321.1 two-component response regulator [Winogradskyella psychrotolerans RS-3]
MLHHYLKIVFYFFPILIIAQNIDPVALEDDISKLNDQQLYETSLLKLDKIIQNPKSDSFDKAHAHIQMAYTFKRVYNYVMTINKLDLAETEAKTSIHREELEAQILAEKMFVYFDMQDQSKVSMLLKKLADNKVKHLTRETLAHYYTVLGTVAFQEEDYVEAEENYDLAISILEQDNPKHLPNIYRAKLALYSTLGDYTKVMKAFEKGLYYAEKHNVPIYDIIIHEGLTKHYENIGDYENALKTQQLVSKKRDEYKATNNSEKLLTLQNSLKQERLKIELEAKQKQQFYLIVISITVITLIIVLLVLLRVYKQKNKLILHENQYIRKEVERLTTEIDTKNNPKTILESHNLTERQLEVIKLVQEGKTNKEIGGELYISENTVKYHLKAIYELLGVKNRIVLRQTYEL